jgi:hypothetical protein
MDVMTRASHQRIAKRAAKFDPPDFTMPPPGMLSEQVDLEAYGLVLGLVHPDDGPLMVAVWDGERLRRLLPEQASTWADELVAAGQAVPLAPVIEAIRTLVKRVGEIVTASIMRQMEVEGQA